ncbi:DUF6354 family protein [Micromonospora maritima]|uniref:DUF6354 family protein n=1 Tax=Micromonospora maritima TaxID=986711 RepID=UPI00157CC43C|nr:hypothetical protein [Micromonospora maritima]
MAEKNLPAVRVGQIWADNDKRSEGRLVKVTAVDSTHADVIAVDAHGEPSPSILRARRTRIRLNRFRPTSTGYRLVRDVEG